MDYYFVSKSAQGELIGEMSLAEINRQLRDRQLSEIHVATPSQGTDGYAQVIKNPSAVWTSLADLTTSSPVQGEPTDSSTNATASRQSVAVMQRYSDSYNVARSINGFGTIIKVVGITLAVPIVLVGLLLISGGRLGDTTFPLGFVLLFLGLIVGALFYFVGVLASASGQILKATLDGAVHSSPFLTDESRAKVMSLPAD